MSKTKESSLWQWLSKASLPKLHMQRIENAAGVGTPDVEGCLDGDCFWIELKVAETANGLVRVHITPEQVFFLQTRKRAGGSAMLLVQVGTMRLLFPATAILHELLTIIGVDRLLNQSVLSTKFPTPNEVIQYAAEEARRMFNL